jgi:hypothetical protein
MLRRIFLSLVSLVCFAALSPPSHAFEFKSFEVRGPLKEKMRLLDERISVKDRTFRENEIELRQSLFPAEKGFRDRVPESGDVTENGPLFGSIQDYLTPIFRDIAKKETRIILEYNQEYNLGSENRSGFVWQKPMGYFGIKVERFLSPDLKRPDQWIIEDALTVTINGHTYLSFLKEAGLIGITQKQLGIFAGIEFSRTYSYIHYANSYFEALLGDFEKLFLSFTKFNPDAITKMGPYEVIAKQDTLHIFAGGEFHASTPYYVSFTGKIRYDKIKTGEVRAIRSGDIGISEEYEALQIISGHDDLTRITAEGKVEAEFFALIRISLLSYEYAYTRNDTLEAKLGFFSEDFPKLQTGGELHDSLVKVLRFRDPAEESPLLPWLVIRTESKTEKQNHHYEAAIFGGSQMKMGLIANIDRGGFSKTFARHRMRLVTYVKGLVAKLVNSVSQSLVGLDLIKDQYKFYRERKASLEYETSRQAYDESEFGVTDLNLTESTSLSMSLDQNFSTSKTNGPQNFIWRDYATYFAQNFTSLSSKIIDEIGNEGLRGPMVISSTARLGPGARLILNDKTPEQVNAHIVAICSDWRKSELPLIEQAEKIKEDLCERSVTNAWEKYKTALNASPGIPVAELNGLLSKISKYLRKKVRLHEIFGAENVFITGMFSAKTKDGFAFVTFFSDGEYNGLGVIDEFKGEYLEDTPLTGYEGDFGSEP